VVVGAVVDVIEKLAAMPLRVLRPEHLPMAADARGHLGASATGRLTASSRFIASAYTRRGVR